MGNVVFGGEQDRREREWEIGNYVWNERMNEKRGKQLELAVYC